MKRLIFSLLLVIAFTNSFSQDYHTQIINKKVNDFAYTNDFSTPLNAFVSLQYLIADGRWYDVFKKSTYRFHIGNSNEPSDQETTEENKTAELNSTIQEIITYCDSIAEVIYIERDSIYYTRSLLCEQGVWVNSGQGFFVHGFIRQELMGTSEAVCLTALLPKTENVPLLSN